MINNSVVIASTAGFLVDILSEKLHDVNFRVYIADNDKDLFLRINNYFPRFIFIEQCFLNDVTDEYIYKIKRTNENLRIVIWTASDITLFSAARFINAGAESFFSLREKSEKVNKIINCINSGETYCPESVLKVCHIESSMPIFGVPLTDREIQIIKLFDKKDIEIAKALSLSIQTINYHKAKIFRKCGCKRKSEIIKYVVKQGIISPEEFKKEFI